MNPGYWFCWKVSDELVCFLVTSQAEGMRLVINFRWTKIRNVNPRKLRTDFVLKIIKFSEAAQNFAQPEASEGDNKRRANSGVVEFRDEPL